MYYFKSSGQIGSWSIKILSNFLDPDLHPKTFLLLKRTKRQAIFADCVHPHVQLFILLRCKPHYFFTTIFFDMHGCRQDICMKQNKQIKCHHLTTWEINSLKVCWYDAAFTVHLNAHHCISLSQFVSALLTFSVSSRFWDQHCTKLHCSNPVHLQHK